ncbi:MAG: hypothetical protein IJE48_10580 [Clostridia bacterium]|nr:hypothetical protein [Clostridia bacterium]
MDYIQGIAAQTEIFLYAFGFGFLLGILYDIFRTVRLIISGSAGFVLIMDLLYSAVCTFLTFCFVLAFDSGRIRAYVAAGIILGWLVYYFSFGAIAVRVSNAVVSAFRKAFSAVFLPIKRICVKINRKTESFMKKCKKNIRKSDKKQKFILQKYKGIVYNLIGYTGKYNFKKKGND